MDKKVLGLVLILIGVAAVLAGAFFLTRPSEDKTDQNISNNQGANNMDTNDKKIVIYFSRADENYSVGNVEVGNTELLAKEIITKTGADEFKIVPEVAYPANYQETVDQATRERNEQARPEYKGDIDISDYDTIFFGYPIWWGDMPMIVYNFIEKHDWNGKTVIPFNTHEGSGNSGTYETLKDKMSGATLKGDGFNMSGSTARTNDGIKKLDNWLGELGY